jgi:hypothetical protein
MSALLGEANCERVALASVPPPLSRRHAIERWMRGREEFVKLRRADTVFVSYAKSGRTWLRVTLSRFYQQRHSLHERSFLEFDNLKRRHPQIPSIFFTHGNYLRDYTGHWDDRRDFYDRRVLLLVRDPRDVAVSQFFQWKHRMRPRKKRLNQYPPHGADLSIAEFVMEHPAGLRRVVDFLNGWAEEVHKLSAAHVIRYEDLRAEPSQQLAGVLAFLGTPASPNELDDAVHFASYDRMKQLESARFFRRNGRRVRPGAASNPDSFKVRRAKVGGYRDYFSDAQCEAIDAYVRCELSDFYDYGSAPKDQAQQTPRCAAQEGP